MHVENKLTDLLNRVGFHKLIGDFDEDVLVEQVNHEFTVTNEELDIVEKETCELDYAEQKIYLLTRILFARSERGQLEKSLKTFHHIHHLLNPKKAGLYYANNIIILAKNYAEQGDFDKIKNVVCIALRHFPKYLFHDRSQKSLTWLAYTLLSNHAFRTPKIDLLISRILLPKIYNRTQQISIWNFLEKGTTGFDIEKLLKELFEISYEEK